MAEQAARIGAEAALWTTDVWRLIPDMKRVEAVGIEKWREMALRHSTAELEAQGFGRRVEAISVAIEAQAWVMTIWQNYERFDDIGGVEQIRFTGEPEEHDSSEAGARFMGRMLQFSHGDVGTSH